MDNNFSKHYFKYIDSISKSLLNANIKNIFKATELIIKTIKNNKKIYVCGNGGSAAIANHYICDYLKLIRGNTRFKPEIISLSSNIETITAISNDISFDEIFKYQAETLIKGKDILILISASGNSKNIVKVVKWCKKNNIKTIGFTGFSGGQLSKYCSHNIHVELKNYGQIEDIHHMYMHLIMQFIINIYKNSSKIIV